VVGSDVPRRRYNAFVIIGAWYCWAFAFLFLSSGYPPSFVWAVIGAWSCICVFYSRSRLSRGKWMLVPLPLLFVFPGCRELLLPLWMAVGYSRH